MNGSSGGLNVQRVRFTAWHLMQDLENHRRFLRARTSKGGSNRPDSCSSMALVDYLFCHGGE
jgi:hypothetical protein